MRTSIAGPAVLFGYIAILLIPGTSANEFKTHSSAQKYTAEQLNREQLAWPTSGLASSRNSAGAAEEVGILFLRGDGGDPNELRDDGLDNLIFIARRNGAGRIYRNGREVEINPAVMESVGQIAVAQFSASTGRQIATSSLPATAQSALNRFQANGTAPRVIFAHIANREDTAKVAEERAAKILSLQSSAAGGDQKDILAVVKMAMRIFGLKSDVCDTSPDPRCDLPGVREAFAEIRREEALQQASVR